MIITRLVLRFFNFLLIISLVICGFSAQAENQNKRNHEPAESDIYVLINIHNIEKFMEFRFDAKTNRVHQLSEGLVKKIEERGKTKYVLWSQSFHEMYLKNLAKRSAVRTKYGRIFSLKDDSLAETSKSEQYIAYVNFAEKNTLNVVRLSHSSVILKKQSERRIRDIAWIGDKAICLLTSSSETGNKPWELFLALSGHPTQYESFFLEIYSIDGEKVFETSIFHRLKYGDGHIMVEYT